MIATLTTSKNPQKNPCLHHIITPGKGCSLDYDRYSMGQGFGNTLGELIGAGRIPTQNVDTNLKIIRNGLLRVCLIQLLLIFHWKLECEKLSPRIPNSLLFAKWIIMFKAFLSFGLISYFQCIMQCQICFLCINVRELLGCFHSIF